MKKITEYFTAAELLSINALAQCLKEKYFKENENAFELVFADALLSLISCASLRSIWNHLTD